MKALSILLIFCFIIAVGFFFIYLNQKSSVLDTWSVEDEKMVEQLPMCPDNIFPEGNWKGVPLGEWPCRLDLAVEN